MAIFCTNCHKMLPIQMGNNTLKNDGIISDYCPGCQEIIKVHDTAEITDQPDKNPAKNNEIEIKTGIVHSPSIRLFPFDSARKGQLGLMTSIYQTLESNGNLVVHAPTGLGKTVSVLTPGLMYAVKNNKKIFFLTSRHTQHRIAIDTLNAIKSKHSFPFSVVDIISKHKMCPREPEFRNLSYSLFNDICKMEIASHRCRYHTKKGAKSMNYLHRKILHSDELIKYCKSKGLCPYKIAMELGKEADVIICDYNYIFSDISETILPKFDVELSDIIVIVDEAHNLPARIREHLSYELVPQRLFGIVPGLKAKDKFLARMISEIATMIEGQLSNIAENKSVLMPKAGILTKIDAILHSTLDKIMSIKQFRNLLRRTSSELAANSSLKFQLMNMSKFLECWEFYQESSIRFAIRTDSSARLVVKTLDPAVFSEPIFEKVHSAILMSGTLYPPEMYAELLGLSKTNTNLARYSSPFPAENRWVAVDNSVTTAYKQRDMNMYYKIAVQLHHMLTTIPGNTAVFFTSYELLNSIKKLLDQHPLDKKFLVEARNLTPGGKASIFDELRTNRNSSAGAVLLAVMGGSMAEGIDYPGGMLNGVIIVGLPLAPPSLEQNGLRDYYIQKFGKNKAADYASILPSMNKVLQAAGRSIRSSTDKSVIILMDGRFNYIKYSKFFTEDYKFQDLKELEERCEAFFN